MIQENERRHDASDLSGSQWAIIEPPFPSAGNKSKWGKRELADAVLYLADNGCKRRNLPPGFPAYTTAANFYYAAIKSGLWEKICVALVEKVRVAAGPKATPSYAIIGPQSVKTVSAAEEGGIDGGKTKRRKRHIVEDIMGNLLSISMIQSRVSCWQGKRLKNIQWFCADAGYRKTFEQDISGGLGLRVDISARIKPE